MSTQKAFHLDGIQVNMVPKGHWIQVAIGPFQEKGKTQKLEAKEKILKAKCDKTDIEKIAKPLDHLNHAQQEQVFEVLKKYEDSFQETRGNWREEPIKIKLRKDINLSTVNLSRSNKYTKSQSRKKVKDQNLQDYLPGSLVPNGWRPRCLKEE